MTTLTAGALVVLVACCCLIATASAATESDAYPYPSIVPSFAPTLQADPSNPSIHKPTFGYPAPFFMTPPPIHRPTFGYPSPAYAASAPGREDFRFRAGVTGVPPQVEAAQAEQDTSRPPEMPRLPEPPELPMFV